MNERNLILKLNNYGYSPEVLEEVREFKATGKIPDYIKGKARYSKKWQPFYIADNHLIYRPKELKVILDPDEKQQIMKEVFDNDRRGVGSGVSQFYHNICLKYLNIQRKEVADFLMRQKTYQISRNTRHRINKPILAFAPTERWAVDLVDMNRYIDNNKQFRYILVLNALYLNNFCN
jgi:thermostable 8-oxoguanine DNA glycosylase